MTSIVNTGTRKRLTAGAIYVACGWWQERLAVGCTAVNGAEAESSGS